MPARRPLEVRFWEKVRKGDGCWEWTAALNNGYGWIGTGVGTKSALAHRVSWEMVHGPIPDGLYACHKCDNPLCVRPDHLFLGDQLANQQDRQSKRRGAHADTAASVKITAADVVTIRGLAARGEMSSREMSQRFGVGVSTINRIISRERRDLVA